MEIVITVTNLLVNGVLITIITYPLPSAVTTASATVGAYALHVIDLSPQLRTGPEL